jgi:4-amino-4-deoxy-L-arabinose transferase-like glycosyltransferase
VTRRLALGVVILICVFWGVASITFPLGWDQAIMASVGDVVLQGGMPYRDAWDMKGPLAYLWYAVAQLIFGRSQFGIRIFDLALLIAASLALATAAARVIRPSAKPWAAAALILCYASMGYFHTAQADGAVALLLTLALSPLLRPDPKPRSVALAGLAVGIATLVKPVFILYLFMPAWAAIQRGDRKRYLSSELAVTAAAAAAPVAVMLLWFSLRGAVGDLIDVHIRFAAGYSEVFELALRDRARGLARYLMQPAQAVAALLGIFGGAVLWRRTQPIARLTIAWFLASLAIVILQRKFFGYHWSLVFPPAILLAAAGIDELIAPRDGARNSNRRAILGYAGSAAIFAGLAAGPMRDVAHFGRYVAGLENRDTYYAGFRHEDNDFCAADEMAAAEYVKAHTSDADRIAIFGYDAPVLYLSGRRNATRLSFPLPLVGWRSTRASRIEYQREFMDALRDPPAYLVVGLLFPDRAQAFAEFPELGAYLEQGYVKERSFGVVDLYRRK